MKYFLIYLRHLVLKVQSVVTFIRYNYKIAKIKVRDSGVLYFFYKWVIRILTLTPVLYYGCIFLYWNYQYHSIGGAYDLDKFSNLVDLVYYYARYGYFDNFIPQSSIDCNLSEEKLNSFFNWLQDSGEIFVPFEASGDGEGIVLLLEDLEEIEYNDVAHLDPFYETRKEPFLTEDISNLRISIEEGLKDMRSQGVSLSHVDELNTIISTPLATRAEINFIEQREKAADITPDNVVTNWDTRLLTAIPTAAAVYLPNLLSIRYEDHYTFVYEEISDAIVVTLLGVQALLVFDWVPVVFWECLRVLLEVWEQFRFIVINELELVWWQELVDYMWEYEGGFEQLYDAIEPYLYWPLKLQLLYSLLSTILNEIFNPRGIVISLVNFEIGNSVFFNYTELFNKVLGLNFFFDEVYFTIGYFAELLIIVISFFYGLLFFSVMFALGSLSFIFEYWSYVAAGLSSGIVYMHNFFSLSLLVEFIWYLLEDHFEVVCDTTEIWLLPSIVISFVFFTYSSFITTSFLTFSLLSSLLVLFFLRVDGLMEYFLLTQSRLKAKFEKLHFLDPYQENEVLYTERYKVKHFVEHAEFNSAAGLTVKLRDIHNHIVLCTLDQGLDEEHDVPIGGAIQEWNQYLTTFVYLFLGSFLLKITFHLYPYMYNASEYCRYYSPSAFERVSDYNGGVDRIEPLTYDLTLFGYRDSHGTVTVVQDIDFYDDHFYYFYSENGHVAMQDYWYPIINFNVTYASYLIDTYFIFFTSFIGLFLLLFSTSPLVPTNIVAIELHQSGYNWMVFFASFVVIISDEADGGFMTVVLDQFIEWWYVRLDDDEVPMWEATGYSDFETLELISTLDRFPYRFQAGGGDVVGTVFSKNTRNINVGFPLARVHLMKRSITNLRGESSFFSARDLTSYMRVLSNDFRSHIFDKYFYGSVPVSSRDILSTIPRSLIKDDLVAERRTPYRLKFRPQTIYRVIGKGIPPVVVPKKLPGPLLPYIQMIPQDGESLMRKLQRVRLKRIKEMARKKHHSHSMHDLNNKKKFMIYQNDPRNPERMKKRNKNLI